MIFLRTDWIRRINRKIFKKLSFHDSRKASGSDPRLVHIAKELSVFVGWKGSYTVSLSKPTHTGHKEKPGLF